MKSNIYLLFWFTFNFVTLLTLYLFCTVCFLKLFGTVPNLTVSSENVSKESCADSCLADWECIAFQYDLSDSRKCYLIKNWGDLESFTQVTEQQCQCQLFLKSLQCDQGKIFVCLSKIFLLLFNIYPSLYLFLLKPKNYLIWYGKHYYLLSIVFV